MPEFRGRGLGKTLLATSLAQARHIPGLEEIQLIVAVHKHEAVSLYERHGFLRVWTERCALKYGDHYVDAHHMVLDMTRRDASPIREPTASSPCS